MFSSLITKPVSSSLTNLSKYLPGWTKSLSNQWPIGEFLICTLTSDITINGTSGRNLSNKPLQKEAESSIFVSKSAWTPNPLWWAPDISTLVGNFIECKTSTHFDQFGFVNAVQFLY